MADAGERHFVLTVPTSLPTATPPLIFQLFLISVQLLYAVAFRLCFLSPRLFFIVLLLPFLLLVQLLIIITLTVITMIIAKNGQDENK